jgi:hypothetical protein
MRVTGPGWLIATLPWQHTMYNDKSPNVEEIALTWISYHLWSATRPRPDHPTAEERREEDAEADRMGFLGVGSCGCPGPRTAGEGVVLILRLIELSPDDRVLADVAAGPLDVLLGLHPYEFIARVENRARSDAKFRRCLSGVWGWSSIPDDVQVRMQRAWEGEEPLQANAAEQPTALPRKRQRRKYERYRVG